MLLIFLFCFGLFLWSGVIGFYDVVLQSAGCIFTIIGIAALIFLGLYMKSGRIFISLLCGICFGMLFLFGGSYFGIVPFLPSQPIYGLLTLPFLAAAPTLTVTEFVMVKKKGRKEEKFLVKVYEKRNKIENVTIERMKKK